MTSIIERANYFTSLPQEYYTSEERCERERDQIFSRQWLYVGHICQIPNSGDYLACELQNESILVVRGEDDEVHGLFNVCRHRGYRFCDAGSGNAKQFVCPYHRWSYGPDGTLLGAPSHRDGETFDYADFGLHKVHLEVWQGFIFINLSETEPPELKPILDEHAPEMFQLEPERIKLAHHIEYEVGCNWKLLMENYLECYHCAPTHPELCAATDLHAILEDVIDTFEPVEYVKAWMPIKSGMKSLSLDGEYVSQKLLGEFGRGVEPPDGFGAGVIIQPAISGILFQSDYGVVHRIDPVSATECKLQCWWFVRDDAEEGTDYELEPLVTVWDKTNLQDIEIVEHQQAGVSSRKYVPGPNSLQKEPGIRAALTIYLHMMGEPTHLLQN